MPIIDDDELQKMTSGDKDLLADLAIMFVQQLPDLQARIRFGIENGAPSEIESCAHQLKSRVSYFGATQLRQRVEDLETAAASSSTENLSAMQRDLNQDILRLIDELRQLTDLELTLEA